MEQLLALVSQQEDWVLQRVIDYAKVHDYTRYTSTLIEAWRISIASLNVAMQNAIEAGITITPPSLDDKFNETVIDQFSIEEVHRHRARGITLGMFLGLVKYYRRSYFDLVRLQNFDLQKERDYLTFLENFFDRFEIGYSVEWNALNATQAADELRDQNRTLTNEKNKYLTIFESLYDPVILLGRNNTIENINQAAVELFQAHNLPTHRYYDQHPADQVLPWLAQDLAFFSGGDEQEWVVVKTIQTTQGERHFQVKMKRMQDVSEKYRGTVLILNDLTERIQKEEAVTLSRATQKWVNSLVDLSRRISSGVDTDDILLAAMEALFDLARPDGAVLGMWEPEPGLFRLKYRVSADVLEKTDVPYAASYEGLDQYTGTLPGMSAAGQSLRILPIPLKMNDQVVGRLWVGRAPGAALSMSEIVVLESIAQQMSIAVEHATMTAQVQSGATLAERTRLAREMHDGLAQILGFLSLEMQSLESLVHQGKIDETLTELRIARERIRDAQAEVRENILNLRTALSRDGHAIPLLCEYIDDFGQQTNIATHVACANQQISLAPLCEVQLVRIMQEALTNVRLHAQARNLWVSFEPGEAGLRVTIRDDGLGFVETKLRKHFGLKSMRERTESVGGQLNIDSGPGQGTCVTLCLPLAAAPAGREAIHAQTVAA